MPDVDFRRHRKRQARLRKIVRAERFTGVAEVGFKRPTDALRNPLGLYVNAFNWSRD